MPSRTLFPGPLAGSLTRRVFAWSGKSGRMTRLVVVHGEGADRAPMREVFFFCLHRCFEGPSLTTDSTLSFPGGTSSASLRSRSSRPSASSCRAVCPKNPRRSRLPLYGHHRPVPFHRSLSGTTVVGSSVCILHRSEGHTQSSAGGAVREARGTDLLSCDNPLSREAAEVQTAWRMCWFRVLLRASSPSLFRERPKIITRRGHRISSRASRMLRLRHRHPLFPEDLFENPWGFFSFTFFIACKAAKRVEGVSSGSEESS